MPEQLQLVVLDLELVLIGIKLRLTTTPPGLAVTLISAWGTSSGGTEGTAEAPQPRQGSLGAFLEPER